MNWFLKPVNPIANTHIIYGILTLLFISSLLIFLAPLSMPREYSWAANVISESAAQGQHNAWIARMGFITYGFAVLMLCQVNNKKWGRGAYSMHILFGIFMVSTAAFSHKPWISNVSYDAIEDLLHSITATGMGFAFSIGVFFCFLQRQKYMGVIKLFDIVAISAAIILPISSLVLPELDGLLQRLMFFISYLWYGYEALTQKQ